MIHPDKHHPKVDQPAHKEMKLLAAPKETKFETPKSEKLDLFFDKFSEKVSFIEKQVSKQTFYLTHLALLVFGLVFCLGMAYVLNDNSFWPKVSNNISSFQTITKAPTSFNLDVNSPEDNFLSFKNTVLISGKTSPTATVVISTNSQDVVTEASNFGNFSQAVNLDPGQNDIAINSFDSQGNTKSKTLSVFYSEETL